MNIELNGSTPAFEDRRRSALERSGLFTALSEVYPLSAACNISKNSYYYLQRSNFTSHLAPDSGAYDELIAAGASTVAESGREEFLGVLSRAAISDAFAEGRDSVRLESRQRGDDGVEHWIENVAIRVENAYDGDVLAILIARPIDEQKAAEAKLREALEITTGKLSERLYFGSLINDVAPGLVVVRYFEKDTPPFLIGNLAIKLGYDREEFAELYTRDLLALVHPEDRTLVARLIDMLKRRSPREYEREFRILSKDGTPVWLMAHGTRFSDASGVGYIHIYVDISQRRALTERLGESERIMRVVAEQSGRVVYYCDLENHSARAMDTEACRKLGLPIRIARGDDAASSGVFEDSMESLREFTQLVRSDEPEGETRLHVLCEDKLERWFDLHVSPVRDEGRPKGAVISLLDATFRHATELSYAAYLQSIDSARSENSYYLETDLTADLVEKSYGLQLSDSVAIAGMSHSRAIAMILEQGFAPSDRQRAADYFSLGHLLDAFAAGLRDLTDDWRVKLPGHSDFSWANVAIQLVADPYTDHVKAFVMIRDITKDKEALISIQRRANIDGLTGVNNRAQFERLAREHLSAPDCGSSMLILLDLDDLKLINDSYGHAQGDRALRSIAGTLKKHFRSSDIIGRVGGDEFSVFLPSVVYETTLRSSVAALVRELALLPVGESNEQTLHCSVGCAMGLAGQDSFDVLYKRADTALYHVKRNGKNDYVFYCPDMDSPDYRYHGHRLVSPGYEELFSSRELHDFLRAISAVYPLVASINLSRDRYYLMESATYHVALPTSGTVSELFGAVGSTISDERRKRDHLGGDPRGRALAAFESGQTSFRFACDQCGGDGVPRRIEVLFLFYKNTSGDVCAFGLAHPTDETPKM